MVAAVAIFAAASCNKELPQGNELPVGETVVYTASVDGADTKAVLNEDTKKSEWVADDAITVHDGTTGWTFTAKEAGPNVDFSNSEGFGKYRPVIAVYPAGTYTANVTEKTVNANIPTYQPARKGTYNEEAALAVAYSENDQFAFKNAHSLIKFTIKSSSIKAIEFYGNNNEAITGNMLVSLNDDNTVRSVVGQDTVFEEGKENEWTGKGTWVKIYSEDETNGWCFENGATYYAAVAPVNFTKGVAINYILADDTKVEAVKKTDNPVNLTPSKILNIGDLEYEAPVVHEWAVAGTFNGWSTTANPMELVDGYYVVKNVTGLNYSDPNKGETGSSTGIKFVNNGDIWRGGEGKVTAGTWYYVWGDGRNVYVEGAEANDAYDIYLNPSEGDYGKYVIVAAGNPMPEDVVVEEEVVVDYWAVIGSMTDNWGSEVKMTLEGDLYVAKDVKILTSDQFKFRANGDANWTINRGAEGAADGVIIADNVETTVIQGGRNLAVTADGVYSIYINKYANKAKVVKTADLPVESIPGQPTDWALAGTFNSWGDAAMVTTTVPDLFVIKNITLDAYAEFKVKKKASGTNDGWGTNYGVKSVNYLNSNVWVTVQSGSGTNISVTEKGTYDIYFDLVNVRLYVMKAGVDYTTSIEQTTNGKAPVISNARTIYLKAGSWSEANAWFIAYTWGGASSAAMVKMEKSSKGNNIYECEVPKDRTNIIFLRKNPSNTSMDWNGEWNRFEMTLPADKNCFTINGWQNGGWSNI